MAGRPDLHSGGQQAGTGAPGTSTSLRSPLNTEPEPADLRDAQAHCNLLRSKSTHSKTTKPQISCMCFCCLCVIYGLLVTLNCMTQPLSGIMSCVTAYTSLPSALPHTITPSGELQKRCTEQSSENSQWSLTDNTQSNKH